MDFQVATDAGVMSDAICGLLWRRAPELVRLMGGARPFRTKLKLESVASKTTTRLSLGQS